MSLGLDHFQVPVQQLVQGVGARVALLADLGFSSLVGVLVVR